MFDQILEAYKNGDDTLFEARVRNWLDSETTCPFEPGSPERTLFMKAVHAHKRWRGKGISFRYSKILMVDYVRQIAEMQKNKHVSEPAKTPAVVNDVRLEEPEHMTGVIPENDHFFKKSEKKN